MICRSYIIHFVNGSILLRSCNDRLTNPLSLIISAKRIIASRALFASNGRTGYYLVLTFGHFTSFQTETKREKITGDNSTFPLFVVEYVVVAATPEAGVLQPTKRKTSLLHSERKYDVHRVLLCIPLGSSIEFPNVNSVTYAQLNSHTML